MDRQTLWKIFESTGRIADYLAYKETTGELDESASSWDRTQTDPPSSGR